MKPTLSTAVLRGYIEARQMHLAVGAHSALTAWRRDSAVWILLLGDGF